MPNRISAGVGDHPCSLTFIYILPIDCKITNFSLGFFVYFLKDCHTYFLAHTQLLISGKPVSQYALYSLIFSALQMENSMKSISTINPAITKNTNV